MFHVERVLRVPTARALRATIVPSISLSEGYLEAEARLARLRYLVLLMGNAPARVTATRNLIDALRRERSLDPARANERLIEMMELEATIA